MKRENYVLEKRKVPSDSVRRHRALFLSLISELQPNVVRDLWDRLFLDFSFVVAQRFKKDLLGDAERNVSTGKEVVRCLLAQAMRQWEANKSLKANDDNLLSSTFSRFSVIDPERLKEAFPNWATLLESKGVGRAPKQIIGWSLRWNLDADWCRDHALDVLREWVGAKELKWELLIPGLAQQKGWTRAVLQKSSDLIWSRSHDALQMSRDEPPLFDFHWEDVHFHAGSWNYFDEEVDNWQRKTMLDFRIWLSEKELAQLNQLKKKQAWRPDVFPVTEFEKHLSWRNGALRGFNSGLSEYVREMRKRRDTAKTKYDLIEVGEKHKLRQHLQWTVEYQVCGNTLREIAEPANSELGNNQFDLSTIQRGVDGILRLIALKRRPDAKQGRRRGSKNKQSILTQLGR